MDSPLNLLSKKARLKVVLTHVILDLRLQEGYKVLAWIFLSALSYC